MYITVTGRKVIASRTAVRLFAAQWPCHNLSLDRAYWFEFDQDGDLIDTDVPEQNDGPAAVAMADDCKAFLMDGTEADWMVP